MHLSKLFSGIQKYIIYLLSTKWNRFIDCADTRFRSQALMRQVELCATFSSHLIDIYEFGLQSICPKAETTLPKGTTDVFNEDFFNNAFVFGQHCIDFSHVSQPSLKP